MGGKCTCAKQDIKLVPGPLYTPRAKRPLHVGYTLRYMFNFSASSNAGNPTNVKNVDSHFRNPPSYLISTVRRLESLLSTTAPSSSHLPKNLAAQDVPDSRRT